MASCNPHAPVFGVQRLDQVIAESAFDGAAGIKGAIVSEWEEMLGEQEPVDDTTLLVLERLG
jgi:serine phosphatase RsbU (regulator of sigma subunit)